MFNWFSNSKPTVVVQRDPKDNYRIYPANIYNPVGISRAGWSVERRTGDSFWIGVCIFDTIDGAQQAIDFLIKQGK